ncbi:phosphogluconate dehydratase [Candidatus Phycosocius spiralis]|uniref:Phosphogluconate dehydratase n=1 Tax=Candidatus Phycosocius spiralis TaxID=2815099 RepID=A0ABQ4PXD7_9PROT|nr:phosphogluconate dehydratase [Candidatus Phycosocius spiralis]GIU67755.1 phosphogluconate dehydratase [Candidatus Phycosocius spiralis]
MSAPLHPTIAQVTARIQARSKARRQRYLDLIETRRSGDPARARLAAANQAHGFAACPLQDKEMLKSGRWANIGIVTAYNDMLSAHQPLATYPEIIKKAARKFGATAQVAGGVPAMCDGITQGFEGMELSLFSRDTIAMSTAIALSHDTFDAVIYLGVCDKIVPGLLIGALRHGWLPSIFCPAGPMPSGLPNPEKARIRQLFAEGKVGRDALLEAESQSYHSPGTCTFYGTANSNQMLMEIMGLHVPGSAFINPNTPLRTALVENSALRASQITQLTDHYTPIGHVVDARSIVNAIVGLCATGGSTNQMIHIPAIARAAGLIVDWDDFNDISSVTPLLCKVYPNGVADVNHFHAAGGMGYLIRVLLDAGLVHGDVITIAGKGGLTAYTQEPYLSDAGLKWRDAPTTTGDDAVIASIEKPFSSDGGLRVLKGNLGRACVKVSAVKPEHRVVEAPARVFKDQASLHKAFNAGELDRDVVVVVRGQGPRATGMPELHKLTPPLGVILDRGFKVALVTDGRMSGASGKVLAAIHVSPEAKAGGLIGKIQNGDLIRVDAEHGILDALVPEAIWQKRPLDTTVVSGVNRGFGRELFSVFRDGVSHAEAGALPFGDMDPDDPPHEPVQDQSAQAAEADA